MHGPINIRFIQSIYMYTAGCYTKELALSTGVVLLKGLATILTVYVDTSTALNRMILSPWQRRTASLSRVKRIFTFCLNKFRASNCQILIPYLLVKFPNRRTCTKSINRLSEWAFGCEKAKWSAIVTYGLLIDLRTQIFVEVSRICKLAVCKLRSSARISMVIGTYTPWQNVIRMVMCKVRVRK